MVDKIANDNRANLAREIADRYELKDLSKALSAFLEMNKKYKAHILFIGGYSAGKSALLNKYIGKDALVEDQGPQTNVATELHYSKEERIIATLMDGSQKKVTSTDDVDVDTVRYVEYYLDSENIKKQVDYILVDTPGFDSGVERHNKALVQYIDYGTAYILVIDCEKGTISDSALNFVNEVSGYGNDFEVVINKCDKKVPEDVMAIKEHIEELILVTCGKEVNVACTSIYDSDVADKIDNIINRFSPQLLYKKNVTEGLNNIIDSLKNSLIVIKEKRNCDTSILDEEIANREKAKKRLLEQIEAQKNRLTTKLHNEVKERILNRIKSELLFSAPMLAQAYQGGTEVFQQAIIDIIRPILISELEEYSTVACEDFIKHIDYNVLSTGDNSKELTDIINSVYSKLIALNDKGLIVMNQAPNGESDDEAEKSLAIYKTIMSLLAISTEYVWPPLELIIVFLPDIIKLLNTLTGTSKEQQLTQAIETQVIPQIIYKVRAELDKSLSAVEEVMLESICTNIEEIIDIESEALEAAKQKKEQYIADYADYTKQIEEDIAMLINEG